MNARSVFDRWIGIVVAMVAFGSCGVSNAGAALLYMEWADTPGVVSKTLAVGQSAMINIRLDLNVGEAWGRGLPRTTFPTSRSPDSRQTGSSAVRTHTIDLACRHCPCHRRSIG